MNILSSQVYLSAFMKTAQYLASLTAHEDVRLHIREVMVNFYGATLCGFATRGSDLEPEYHHLILPAGVPSDLIGGSDFQETVIDVLETGFLAQRIIRSQPPHVIIFLPVTIDGNTSSVLLVGHADESPVPPELLNVYLAVAGLAGTTITRLNSEVELKKHRTHLEDLVAERTIKLTEAMKRLEVEISERKQAENALRLAKDELETRVVERTAELTKANQELKEKTRKLESLNSELQEFAFVASHDLQEPLRKIQTFGNLLAVKFTDSIEPDGLDYLMRMTRAADRMSELLRSLLNYSRIVTQPNPFVSTSLAKIIQEAASDLELVIKRANGRIEVGELPVINADATQLRQLFENLIGNAMKYSKESEPPVVKIYSTEAEGICRVFVEDNGIGFEENYVDRIFRPFQRLHGRNSRYDGTGMGLAICRKIVERHGGSITARSVPGQGTIFIIQMPGVKTEARKGR